MEKEVRRLFRYDSEAIEVKYEIIIDDEKSLSDSGTSQVNLALYFTLVLKTHFSEFKKKK